MTGRRPAGAGTPGTGPSGSVATCRFVPAGPGDPLDGLGPGDSVFAGDDLLMIGSGTARTIRVGDGPGEVPPGGVAELLAAIPCDDRVGRPGSGVVALGALPFERSSPGMLTVPERLRVHAGDGTAWETVVPVSGPARAAGPGDRHASVDRPAAPAPAVHPEQVELHFDAPDRAFTDRVAHAVAAIRRGELAKVVLARRAEVRYPGSLDVPSLVARWRGLEPSCTVFAVPTRDGVFVGASPELLVSRRASSVVSRPLAGTADGIVDLLASSKDAEEHRLVVEAIAAVLDPWCSSLDVPGAPGLVHLHSVTHLGTEIRGTLARTDGGRPGPSVLDLVTALHPTPAVGGVPTAAAVSMIAELEGRPRGPYAGPVGWTDASGDGDWVVGIRAAEIVADGARHGVGPAGDVARLSAGVGIVAGSDPEAELRETGLKFRAVLDALVPGHAFPGLDARPLRAG